MVDVISLNFLVDSILFVVFVHIIQELMTLSKFVNHELLKLNNINDVEKSLNLVEDHYAELISYAAVAVLSHNKEKCFHDLASYSCWDKFKELNVFVWRFWNIVAHNHVLC